MTILLYGVLWWKGTTVTAHDIVIELEDEQALTNLTLHSLKKASQANIKPELNHVGPNALSVFINSTAATDINNALKNDNLARFDLLKEGAQNLNTPFVIIAAVPTEVAPAVPSDPVVAGFPVPSVMDEEFSSFVASVVAAKPIVLSDDHSYLPLEKQPNHTVPPKVLTRGYIGPRLFVRGCYQKLFNLIVGHRNQWISNRSARSGTMVTGNAGIGKSVFHAFLIREFHLARCQVIYHLASISQFVLIPSDSTTYRSLSPNEAARYLSLSSTVCLVELGAKPMFSLDCTNAFQIVVASPHSSRITELSDWWKGSISHLLYMPCWSCEELLLCRGAIAPLESEHSLHPLDNLEKGPSSVSVEHVKVFFQKYGGIVRYAFDPEALVVVDDHVRECIRTM